MYLPVATNPVSSSVIHPPSLGALDTWSALKGAFGGVSLMVLAGGALLLMVAFTGEKATARSRAFASEKERHGKELSRIKAMKRL